MGSLLPYGSAPLWKTDASNIWAIPTNKTLKLLNADQTFTAQRNFIVVDRTYTLNYSNIITPLGYSFNPTFILQQDGFAFGQGSTFATAAIQQNSSGSTRNFGPTFAFVSAGTVRADGGSISQPLSAGFFDVPTFSTINAGTISVTSYEGFRAGMTINAGATVATRRGFSTLDATVAGVLTDNIGFYADSLATGTNRYAMQLAAPAAAGATQAFTMWIGSAVDDTTPRAGMVFGLSRDTNLYRSAVNTLKSDSNIETGSVFIAPSGSVGSPSFTFAGDTDNGMYKFNTNTPALVAGGVNRLQIGTTAMIINTTGTAYNVTIQSDNDASNFVSDGTNDRIGIGTASPNSKLSINGSLSTAITSTSTDITLNTTHYTVLVDASGAARIITLPAATGATGRIYTIKKTDNSVNTVTVDGNASETIDGALTYVLSLQWKYVTIQSNGTAWFVIANN